MLRKIKVGDLRRGMYIVKYGEGTFNDPFVPVEKPLLNGDTAAALLPPEITYVWVDDAIKLDLRTNAKPGQPPARTDRDNQFREYLEALPAAPLEDEILVVEPHYREALSYARDFMHDVRLGRGINIDDAVPLVDRFIESSFRNETAAAAMCKLRKFDEYTFTHCINVSILAIVLGRHLKQDVATLRLLGVAGLFHDVGKAKVPEEVLNKPGKLDPKEFEIMKRHTTEGYLLLRDMKNVPDEVVRAALEHHERHNGQGYPNGIPGDRVGRISRFISVVDVYDALTSKRVYKDAIPPIRALGLMYQWRLSDFYPNSVEHFIKCIGVYPVGSFVRLSTGEYGIVTNVHPGQALLPEVKVILNREMMPRRPKMLDFAQLQKAGLAVPEILECLNPDDYKVDLSHHVLGVQ